MPTPRWTNKQVETLLKAVENAPTNKQGFELAAKQLKKSVGTVQQKYYNLQKASKPVVTKRATSKPAAQPNGKLAGLTTTELVALATAVRSEIDRRRSELDNAHKTLTS